MRKLFLLQGAPGTGKSTLISKLGVERQTLSFDMFRSLYGTVAYAFDGEVCNIPHYYEKQAIRACFEAADCRMHAGDTIFVDNTNTNARSIRDWQKKADLNGYQTFVVDMQGDLSDEVLLYRNDHRDPYKKIGDTEAILKMANSCRTTQQVLGVTYIQPEDVLRELAVPLVRDLEDFYDHVVIVGDVQGCGDTLKELIKQVNATYPNYYDPKKLWVFVGDLFDRGKTPQTVMAIVRNMQRMGVDSPQGGVVVVEGNHERSVRETICNAPNHSTYGQSKESVKILNEAGYPNEDILSLVNNTTPFFAFTYGTEEYWVTHAGIDPGVVNDTYRGYPTNGVYEVGRIANFNFMFGTGFRSESYYGRGSYHGFQDFLESEHDDTTYPTRQYFGHRHGATVDDPMSFEYIRPLETAVEFDGWLSAIVLSKDGTEELVQVKGKDIDHGR